MWSRVAVVSSLLASCRAGLLGAGTGEGSCAAAPFRAAPELLKWSVCPPNADCCSEFGYCRPRSEWDLGLFRDCNGVSNGRALEAGAIAAENAAAAQGDTRGLALLNVAAGASVPATGAAVAAGAAAAIRAPIAAVAPAPAVAAVAPAAPALAVAPAAAAGAAIAGAPGVTYAINGAGATLVNGLPAGGLAIGANGLALGANGVAIGANGLAVNGAGLAVAGAPAAVALNGAGAALTANGYALAGSDGLAALWNTHFGGAAPAAATTVAGGYLPPTYGYAKH